MKTRLIILLLIGFLNDAYSQSLLKAADSIRSHYDIPELCYAVVRADSVFEMAALGRHSILLPDTATLNDRFHLGSNTKAMTAFVIAKYVEEGKLKWTTKFFDLFPEWKFQSERYYRNISLLDLLTHRAGIPPFQGDQDPVVPNFQGDNAHKRYLFAKFVLKQAPVKPSAQHPFVYSNAGYTLAALMLEKVTQMSWETLISSVFNDDLKLSIGFSWPDNQTTKDTWGHRTNDGIMKPLGSHQMYHLDYTEPAGDINMTMPDYVRFIQLNLKGLAGSDAYLKASTYFFIHNCRPSYALGWFNISEGENVFSSHSGTGDFTYYTIAQIDRKKGLAYVAFANAYNEATLEGVRLLIRKMKEAY